MDTTLLFFLTSVGAFAGTLLATTRRKKSARFEATILELRAALDGAIEYRVPRPSDEVDAVLVGARPQLAELESQMRYLGDLVVLCGGRAPIPLCAYCDDAGRVVAHAMIFPASPPKISIIVESYAADGEEWVTKTEAEEDGRPPFSHLNCVAEGTGLTEMLVAHRSFAPLNNPDAHLATFRSLDDAAKMYTRIHDRFREWRRTLTPDELLQIDLKMIVGANYHRWGRGWTRRLKQIALPVAKARR